MICPLHGSRGHVDYRGPPTPPPQLAAVAGYRCRSRNTNIERHHPHKDTPFNAPCATSDGVANDLFYATEGRTSSPGYGWAEPGKGWTRCSDHARSRLRPHAAGTGACARHNDTRRVFQEIHVYSAKTPLSGEVNASSRSCRAPPDVLQDNSMINKQEELGGDRARDTSWAMSYLSRENSIPRRRRVPGSAGGQVAMRHGLRRKHEPAKPRDVEASTRSTRRSAANLVETRVINHKLDSARIYNKGLRDSNSELARQVVALRRKVDAIVAPTSKDAPGRPAHAEAIDEHSQHGGYSGYRSRGNTLRTADVVVEKDRIATSPQSSSQNDSPKGIGCRRRRKRGVPGMKQSGSRVECPVSHRATKEAHSARVDSLPEEFDTKRVPARAQQTRPQTSGRTPPGTHAETRLEAHAQTQTEAVRPVAEDGAGSAAAIPPWRPALRLGKSHHAHNEGSHVRISTREDSRNKGSAVYGETGAIARAYRSPTEHAGASTGRAGQAGSRHMLTGTSALREHSSREELHSCEGSEPEERPEGGAGIDAEAKRGRDNPICASLCGTQQDADDFAPVESSRISLIPQEKTAPGENTMREGKILFGEEDRSQRTLSRVDTRDSESYRDVGVGQEYGNPLPGREIRGIVSRDAATHQEDTVGECSVATVGELDCIVEHQGLQPPLCEKGSGVPALPSLAPSPGRPTNQLQEEPSQAPRASLARKPAEQVGAYEKRQEGEESLETTTRADNADYAAQEEVEQLQRKLLVASRAVAALKIAFVLKRFIPAHQLETAGVGIDRLAAISEEIPRMKLAFARWKNPGGAESSRGVDETTETSYPTEILSPVGTSYEGSTTFYNSTEAAGVAAAGSSSEALVGGCEEESARLLGKTRSSNGERTRDGEDLKQDEKENISILKSPSRRPLSPRTPPTLPPPRSRTNCSNIPTLPTAAAPLPLVGTEESLILVGGESPFKETGSTPETSSLFLNSHRTVERENCEKSSEEREVVYEVPHGDGGIIIGGSRDDRATPQVLSAPNWKKDCVLADGKDDGRDERRTRAREATEHRDLRPTASTVESGRQQQRQESVLCGNGRHTALGLAPVGFDDATVPKVQWETVAEEESGGECGDGQRALPSPSPPCITLNKAQNDAKCSFSIDESAAETYQSKLKDAETEGAGSWDRLDDRIGTACAVYDTGHQEAIGHFDGRFSVSGEEELVEAEVGVSGQGGTEHALSNAVIEEEEEATDASYRRDCAVLAGTAKIVFALVALEHRRISSRFYRWKRTRRLLNRLLQSRSNGHHGGSRTSRRL